MAGTPGNAEDMFTLGRAAEQRGDLGAARDWYQRAADHGHVTAMYNLGALAGQNGDMSATRAWWRRAADHGDADAMRNLGFMAQQDGDRDTAGHWYERAADHGHVAAMNDLGFLAQERGDKNSARAWWHRAADRGNVYAMYSLGLAAQQDGDLPLARTWYQRAADHGHADAASSLEELANLGHRGMDGEMAVARFWQVAEQGMRDLRANRLLEAEQAWEEAVSISGYMAGAQARTDILLAHGTCLANLAETLRRMGANPECEHPLVLAADVFRRLAAQDPGQAEPALVGVLLDLAKVYRTTQYYVDLSRPAITDLDSMREYRRSKFAAGTWGGPMLALTSPEWLGRAEAPLLEALPLLRRLARTDRTAFEPRLALALNLLGETYVNTDRGAQAEPPLREAEAIFRGLVRDDRAFFQPLLTDTLDLLGQATRANAQPRDRIGALEGMLPGLRLEAAITDEEHRHGVTLAKAGARDRLRDALKELASLYEEVGRGQAARKLWDDELGDLATESLHLRLDGGAASPPWEPPLTARTHQVASERRSPAT